MIGKRLRTILTLLFAAVFAVASLGHAPSMAVSSAAPDCHESVAADGGEMEGEAFGDGAGDHPAHGAGMPLAGCPLASLPPLPAPPPAPDRRFAMYAAFASPAAVWPRSANLDAADPPPRFPS